MCSCAGIMCFLPKAKAFFTLASNGFKPANISTLEGVHIRNLNVEISFNVRPPPINGRGLKFCDN